MIRQVVIIPALGQNIECGDVLDRMRLGVGGVLVGRGVLRNPWILAQAADLAAGRPAREVTREMRARFLLDYIALLLGDHVGEAAGFRHVAPGTKGSGTSFEDLGEQGTRPLFPERWVVNKLRALNAWFSKGSRADRIFASPSTAPCRSPSCAT